MVYKIYKLKTGDVHFSEDIADAIITYCLVQMENSQLNFQRWKVGITKNKDLTKGDTIKVWPCTSYLQAAQTHAYFINEKIMTDDTPDSYGDETFIYVYQ